MPTQKYEKWTVVQHSGYGYGGNLQFKQGLEIRKVASITVARKIEKIGGELFDTWSDADNYAEGEMYSTVEGFGLIPAAPGSFASMEVDGLRVYVPERVVVEL